MKSMFLVIVGIIIIIASIFAVIAVDSANLDRICQDSGGKRMGDTCLAPAINSTNDDSQNTFSLFQFKTMRPNSMEYFYYPNPEDTTNRDAFQKFILIRLPEELGGGADDVSAFRAYSALSVSNHCLVKYWPDEGRKRLEDPCWGSMYRPIDGLMITGGKPVTNNAPVALPFLDLSMDENGSLYVEPPVWAPRENGVVGVGRDMSLEDIRLGSRIVADSYQKTNPHHPSLPIDFAGQILTQIHPDSNRVEALYHDFSSTDWAGISIYVNNVSAQDQKYFLNLARSNSEYWQIGKDLIWIGGSALDKNSKLNEGFKEYDIQFISDGFKFRIVGKNVDFMKKSIVANYFPGFGYDDLLLVSSTVEK
ncbi:MAG: hypothetical protein KC444_10050 [Nitrosopumilus sp.]|nr:hypothetical protein [Nitrosopumilus sp.]